MLISAGLIILVNVETIMDLKRKKLILQYIITITKAKGRRGHLIFASKYVCECSLENEAKAIYSCAVLTENL